MDALNISSEVRGSLSRATHCLYRYDLPNAKETFDDLLHKLETETSADVVDHFCLKLAKELSGYVGLEDAVWLVRRRADRVTGNGESRFSSLVSCALVTEQCDDEDVTKEFNERLRIEADLSGEPMKKLLSSVMLAMAHYRQRRLDDMLSSLEDIKKQLCRDDVASLCRNDINASCRSDVTNSCQGALCQNDVNALCPDDDTPSRPDNVATKCSENVTALCRDLTEENKFYLILALERVAFLCRKAGDRDYFRVYHLKALDFCQKRDWDLGLLMGLEINCIRALKTRDKQEQLETHINSLLHKIEQALENLDDFEVKFGTKVLRDAYNDVSVACSFFWICKDLLLDTGVRLYDKWVQRYGLQHHEVQFLASQLAYNYETFELEEEADKYMAIVEDNLEAFAETTKMIMQAKAKTLIHLWKVYRNRDRLREAEFYCREELRINRKHGISQQYVANALRNLAFILKELDRRDEGLVLLKECLQLSKEHSPSLTSFHEKLENEIRKF